ncbi:cytochrome P450 6B6-like [Anticarsia gemmatalis]|uniref:cytochrome P450 6B6-like n=1 Tax=Anticarsia gemmatalis TaxID=129554 RepID=UPI003F771CD5
MFVYLTIALLALFYYLVTRKYSYFDNKNLPHLKPKFLIGNYGDLFFKKKSLPEVVQDICQQFPDEKLIGAFYATEPVLIPIDPETIKLIMTKDFYYFNGREMGQIKNSVIPSLVISHGDTWKVLRTNLTPLFSSAKMKQMFHIIHKCSLVLEKMLDREIAMSKDVEVRDLTSKFTIDCITGSAFGIDANVMSSDAKTNPFVKISANASSTPTYVFIIRTMTSLWPNIFQYAALKAFSVQIKFFKDMITNVMSARNYKHSGRNDFVDLVMGWKENHQLVGDSLRSITTGETKKVSLQVDDDLLVAQCFVFFNAGFETSSTTLSYAFYELAKKPEVQEKVLAEVDAYLERHENKLVYECISEMPYLEACIDETMRLYPVLGIITREQMEDYTFPNGVKTHKGLRVHLPVYYLHHNPKYFPDPEEFRPERFLGEEKKKIIPYTYMPFGDGPRICIGMRFARMQMMAGLITILKKYRLELAAGTPMKLKLKPYSSLTHPEGGITLKFIEREGWESRVLAQD